MTDPETVWRVSSPGNSRAIHADRACPRLRTSVTRTGDDPTERQRDPLDTAGWRACQECVGAYDRSGSNPSDFAAYRAAMNGGDDA